MRGDSQPRARPGFGKDSGNEKETEMQKRLKQVSPRSARYERNEAEDLAATLTDYEVVELTAKEAETLLIQENRTLPLRRSE
jgi:hypothetical protein